MKSVKDELHGATYDMHIEACPSVQTLPVRTYTFTSLLHDNYGRKLSLLIKTAAARGYRNEIY